MKRILVVDDQRVFQSANDVQYAHVPTVAEAEALLWDDFRRSQDLAHPRYDELWLDHDLGPDEDMRRLVVMLEVWVSEASRCHTRILTSNPVGREWIRAALAPHYPVDAA